MRKARKILKIKLGSRHFGEEDFKSIMRWEEEGGKNISEALSLVAKPPIKKGQIFEVADGSLIFENGELYFLAEIDLLALY